LALKKYYLSLFLGIGQFVAPRVVVFGYDRARHDPIYLRMPRKFRFRRFPEFLRYGPKLRNGVFALCVVESFGTGSFGPPREPDPTSDFGNSRAIYSGKNGGTPGHEFFVRDPVVEFVEDEYFFGRSFSGKTRVYFFSFLKFHFLGIHLNFHF
jgi:hypothetical protein